MPAWPITVPQELYDAVVAEADEPYADSYLWGAVLNGTNLIPRTVIAWERLRDRRAVREAIQRLKINLVKPEPWGKPGGSQRSWKEVADEEDLKPRRRRPSFDPW